VATRKAGRAARIGGAFILSLVMLKRFLVDLAGTVARSLSFSGDGSSMLLMGYFSPLSPERLGEDS
jgi:uncharacterized membrane protein